MNLLAALASVRIFPRKVSHQTLTTRWGKALDPQHILEEYPRPQMIRDQYINLNGEWNYTVLFSGSPSFRCRFPVKAARKNAL